MTISNRTITMKGVFAKTASTTIPSTPTAGTSYRKTSITQNDVEKGWPFKNIVDSAEFNEMLYEYSALTEQIEKYGIMPWSNLTDYDEGSICLGSNGKVYQAKQASGPSSSYQDPTSDSSNTYWEIFGTSGFVTLGTAQTITGNKTFSGSVSLGSSATATTPSATDSSTKVATTAWFNLPGVKSKINSWMAISPSSKIQIASGSTTSGEYTPTTNGWIWIRAHGNDRDNCNVSIGSYKVFDSEWTASYGVWDNSFIPVGKGQTVSWSNTKNKLSIYFFKSVGE